MGFRGAQLERMYYVDHRFMSVPLKISVTFVMSVACIVVTT